MTTLAVTDLEAYIPTLPTSRATIYDLAEGSQSVPTPPAFVLGSVSEELGQYLVNRLERPSVRIYVLRQCHIGTDGILIDGEHVMSSWLTNHPSEYVASMLPHVTATINARPVRRIAGQAVLFTAPGHRVYGHWLVDLLPRLYVLRRAGLAVKSLRYLIPRQTGQFVPELLATFGISPDQVVTYDDTTEVVEVEELIVPTLLRLQDRFHPLLNDARTFLLDLFRSACGAGNSPYQKDIFVARSNGARGLENRASIENEAVGQGYQLVHPQRMPIPEQIAMFAGAEKIVGEYGSGLHGCLFSRPGTQVFSLRGSSRDPGLIQSAICEVLDQPLGYALGQTPFAALQPDFSIPEQTFRFGLHCLTLSPAQLAV